MQTIPIIESKIKQYNTRDNYEPLKITCKILPPLYIGNPWIYFDGIIAYLCLRDALGDDYRDLPTDKVINIDKLDLPIKRTEDVYHASVSMFNKPKIKKGKIFKRFTDKETYHLTEKQQKGKIRTNAGHYKDFMIDLHTIITDEIVFYVNGNKYEITRLMKNLTNIGKKTSIGGGKIIKTDITRTDQDYSFYKGKKIMRPIPTNIDTLPATPGSKWTWCTYKPPYWNKKDAKLCRLPDNQLTGSVLK